MKLSLYTAVKNGIFYDYHVVDMLKHHVPLADEIIVNEGYSTDDTLERISGIDPKIKIFRSRWETPKDLRWCVGFKEAARRRCRGDWCIHLDCDEFIPEWEFDSIRGYLTQTKDLTIPVRFVNFYGNYKVYYSEPDRIHWPSRKMIIHRNMPEIEFWGDGSNVRLKGTEFRWDTSAREFTVHHFGTVRNPARLRQKWSFQGRAIMGKGTWFKPPSFLFNLWPHEWRDPELLDGLAIYEGRPIKAVRDNPGEFVRDNFELYEYLCNIRSKRGDVGLSFHSEGLLP